MNVNELLADPEFETYAMARNLTMTLGAVFLVKEASRETLDAAFAAWYEGTYGEHRERRRLRLVDGGAA